MKLITFLSIVILSYLLLKVPTQGIPDGTYQLMRSYCKGGKPIYIVEETLEYSIEAAANYLLFDDVLVTFNIKHPNLLMTVKSPDCQVKVFQKIRTNQNGRFQIEPFQSTEWTPQTCQFKGRVNGHEFVYGRKEALKDHSLGRRSYSLAKLIINQNPEYYPSMLPWDVSFSYRKNSNQSYTFIFKYIDLVMKHNKNTNFIPEGRFLFGCSLQEDGFFTDILLTK